MMIKTLILLAHLTAQDMTCLAENIYHESRGEQYSGQVMVGLVTLKRSVKEGGVCKAVYRPKQFSWTSGKAEVSNTEIYIKAVRIAEESVWTAMYGGLDDVPDHYYAHNKVLPVWAKYGTDVFVIGNHTFMKVGEK